MRNYTQLLNITRNIIGTVFQTSLDREQDYTLFYNGDEISILTVLETFLLQTREEVQRYEYTQLSTFPDSLKSKFRKQLLHSCY